MHELGIAQDVVELAIERAGGSPVRRIVLEVGKLCAVSTEALEFCFSEVSASTAAAGAELVIREVAATAECRRCSAVLTLDRPFGRCACGGTDLTWLGGDQLRIESLEVA